MRLSRVALLLALLGAGLSAFQPPYPIGPGVSAPVAISRTAPEYTPEAKDARVEGEVWLSAVIDEKGSPVEVSVTQPLDPGLDGKAVEAVRQWRFKPGVKDGIPVPVRATIAVKFKLL